MALRKSNTNMRGTGSKMQKSSTNVNRQPKRSDPPPAGDRKRMSNGRQNKKK